MKKRILKKANYSLNSVNKLSKSLESKHSNSCLNSPIKFLKLPYSKRSNSLLQSAIKTKLLPDCKSSQTTIFIILAIIIITIVIVIYVKTYSQKQNLGREYFEKNGLQPSIKNIQNFIIECHEETSKQSLITIGIQGGYYNKPKYYFDMKGNFIPYYYYEGQILMPSKSTIENELSSYIDNNIESCLDKIRFQNFQLDYSKPETETIITPGKATFITILPIKIEHKGNKIDFELNKRPLELNSSLNEIIEVSDYVTNSHKENPELMCVNCIAELARERQLYIDFIAFQEDTRLKREEREKIKNAFSIGWKTDFNKPQRKIFEDFGLGYEKLSGGHLGIYSLEKPELRISTGSTPSDYRVGMKFSMDLIHFIERLRKSEKN